jgi:hexokinase
MIKSKSLCFKSFIEKIDEVLSKVHSKTISGGPLQMNDEEWNNARDRLMSIKVGGTNMATYPINFQMADHLILSEVGSRDKPEKIHIDEYFAKMKGNN